MARDGVFDGLRDLLEREHSAILQGRFDVLERLVVEKERIAAALPTTGPAEDAAVLRAMSERNGALLRAMQRGLEEARRRITRLASGPAELRTYDASGRRTTIGAPGNSHRKRV